MSSAVAFASLFAAAHAVTLTGTLGPDAAGPLTTGTSSDNMQAWANADLRLDGLKPHQIGWPYLDLGVISGRGSTVTVTTGASPAILYSFVYGCYPCPATQGSLVGHMFSSEQWRLGFCGPTFHSAPNGRNFRMISYAKDVPAHSSYTLTLPDASEYAAFIATEDVLVCTDNKEKQACQMAGNGGEQRCKWNAVSSTCDFAYCHGNIGPVLDYCQAHACAPSARTFLP